MEEKHYLVEDKNIKSVLIETIEAKEIFWSKSREIAKREGFEDVAIFVVGITGKEELKGFVNPINEVDLTKFKTQKDGNGKRYYAPKIGNKDGKLLNKEISELGWNSSKLKEATGHNKITYGGVFGYTYHKELDLSFIVSNYDFKCDGLRALSKSKYHEMLGE